VKVGIASSMWRGLADLPFPEYVEYCRQAGADVMELSGWPKSHAGTLTLDDAGVEQVQALTQRAGLEVVAIGSPDDFVQTTPEGMAEQVALVKGFVDLAIKLGVPTISLKVGSPKEGVSEDDAVGLIVEGLNQVAPYALEHSVFLALENRTTLTNNTEVVLRILRELKNLRVRVLLDTGNLLQYGLSPGEVLQAVETLAPYTVHTHLKDGRGHRKEFRPAPLGQGELDMDAILRILRVSGYLHPLCVQYEGPDQPGVYPEDVRYVRERVGNWEVGTGDESRIVRGLHHISISMKSFAAAHHFYGEVLGLPLKSAQGYSYSPVLLFVLPTGEEFHVHLHGPSTHMHVAIEVADFAGTIDRLSRAGVEISGPDRRGDGSEFLFCSDPDGNRLEITHHHTWQPAVLVGRG
jgi:sugar phosphate isomerase/epimerase/catechol 2,3-dioxygenase-like lactoylglutathione lyase family enzyme